IPSGSVSCPSSRSSGRPDAPAGTTPTGARPWTAFSSGCARAASGSSCPASSAPRAPSTTGSNAGAKGGSCNASGRNWSRSATTWRLWTGNGRRRTAGWARPGSGGKKVGKNPTDRGKQGSKESVLVDAEGGPLGAVLAAANVNDHLLLRETIEAIVIERPAPTPEAPQAPSVD